MEIRDQTRETWRWIAAVALWISFGLLGWRAHGPSVLTGDRRLTLWVQGLDWPGLDALTDAANWTTRTVPLLTIGLFTLVVLIRRREYLNANVLFACSVIKFATGPMKERFSSPRPDPNLVIVARVVDTFGFPAGRASGVALVFGAIAWILCRHATSGPTRLMIWSIALAWIVLTGFARVRVGAHWPSDVLGAWLWSTATLLIVFGMAQRRMRTKPACGH